MALYLELELENSHKMSNVTHKQQNILTEHW
jgi:hypothetical protein